MSKVKKVLLTILAALIGVLLLFCAAFYVFFDVPDWQKLDISKLSALAQTSSMYDMNGELMSELRGSENRIIVSLDEIPLHTRQAFIAAEDLRFYDHRGIDVYRILGALRSNLKSGSLAQAPSHSSWPNSPISALKKRFAVSWRKSTSRFKLKRFTIRTKSWPCI